MAYRTSDAIWYFSILDFTKLVFLKKFGIKILADLFFLKIFIYCYLLYLKFWNLLNKVINLVFLPAAKPTGHRIVRVVVVVVLLLGGFYQLLNYSLKYCLIGVCICFGFIYHFQVCLTSTHPKLGYHYVLCNEILAIMKQCSLCKTMPQVVEQSLFFLPT